MKGSSAATVLHCCHCVALLPLCHCGGVREKMLQTKKYGKKKKKPINYSFCHCVTVPGCTPGH